MFLVVSLSFFGSLLLHSGDTSAYPTSTEKLQFRCVVYGYNIPIHLMCDGINNCGDNSDEKNCVETKSTTPKNGRNIEVTPSLPEINSNEIKLSSTGPKAILKQVVPHTDIEAIPVTNTIRPTTVKETTIKTLPKVYVKNDVKTNEIDQEKYNIWKDQTNPDKVNEIIASLTHKELCGRQPWKNNEYQPQRGGRIVGGDDAEFGEWPWQISLQQRKTRSYSHKCGGAILNENWAITAAHCVENVASSDLLLRMGEFDLDLDSSQEPQGHVNRKVDVVVIHPNFDPKTYEYDLALLKFYEPIEFASNVIPICTPEADQDFDGKTAWAIGWGRLSEGGLAPSILQEVSLPIINNADCEAMFLEAGSKQYIPYYTFICAGYKQGGKDSCEGDSGGPLVAQRQDGRFMLTGISSWGIGCGEKYQPGVYTRISEFSEWIEQIQREN